MITLKTVHEANPQDVFDQAAKHLLNQKERSEDKNGLCLYRSSDGLKCAVGCFITDDEYLNVTEGTGVWSFSIGKNFELLTRLQVLHDEDDPESWEKELKALSVREGLKFNKEKYYILK